MYRTETDPQVLSNALWQVVGLRFENEASMQEDVKNTLGIEYFRQDPAVAGLQMDQAAQAILFPVAGEQIYPATTDVWHDAVVLFAVKVAVAAGKAFPEEKHEIELFMGQSAVHLLDLTKPGTLIFVTPNAGVSKTGKLLGTRANRDQFNSEYGNNLNELDPPVTYTYTPKIQTLESAAAD
jgi:hypothetical protein